MMFFYRYVWFLYVIIPLLSLGFIVYSQLTKTDPDSAIEKQKRVHQEEYSKIQEYLSLNYKDWKLRGWQNQNDSHTLAVHILRESEEKVIILDKLIFLDNESKPYVVLNKVDEKNINKSDNSEINLMQSTNRAN